MAQNPYQAQYAITDLAAGAALTGAEAFEAVQGGQSVQVTTAQIKAAALVGTTTNDNAAAGSIGEFITATVLQGAAIGLVTATAKTVTSISLTAGDWDVWGGIAFLAANTTTLNNIVRGSLSPAANTLDTSGSFDRQFCYYNSGATIGNSSAGFVSFCVGPSRFSLAASASVFLIAFSDFLTNTMSAFGTISARRVR